MTGDFARFPERPPSEAEWEDLLVRFEIAPRALKIAVEDAPKTGEAAREVDATLLLAVTAEVWVWNALEALRTGGAMGSGAGLDGIAAPDTASLADAFARFRAKSFAAVQRRGLGVWEWAVDLGDGQRLTAYRLLSAAVENDGRTLAALRAAAHEVRAC